MGSSNKVKERKTKEPRVLESQAEDQDSEVESMIVSELQRVHSAARACPLLCRHPQWRYSRD